MTTAIKAQRMRAVIKQELSCYPEGSMSQNCFRALYEMARLQALSSKSTIPATPEAAHEYALETVRKRFNDFEPQVIDIA